MRNFERNFTRGAAAALIAGLASCAGGPRPTIGERVEPVPSDELVTGTIDKEIPVLAMTVDSAMIDDDYLSVLWKLDGTISLRVNDETVRTIECEDDGPVLREYDTRELIGFLDISLCGTEGISLEDAEDLTDLQSGNLNLFS